ncbi:aminotransferase class V-fold PLP-dependent enzyme [Synechocystis sp. LKSZ1]|uniref:cysteine desulfurase family protein n=1 Tax=Synechocystis sp. LKSZ1 TaxID=3144951 RepID=UPI00336BDED1
MGQRPIYLDNQATTPLDPRVLTAMLPYFQKNFGNPGSQHRYGWEAAAAVKQAREILAAAIQAQPEEIIFTSGATEANNLALKGVAEAYLGRGKHLVTVQTEHSAVLEPCRYLESLGFEVTYLPVQDNGSLDLAQLQATLQKDTLLVSVMAANNEIGVLQPLAEIGRLCRQRGVLFHTDAAQALGKIPLDVEQMSIDLLSITAHKLYGPKGIGALYRRQRSPHVSLAPQLHGGGQEQGLRAGTLFVPQIVGFGQAVALALAEQSTEIPRQRALRERLWQGLQSLGGIYLNGDTEARLAGNLNVGIAGVKGTSLLLALQPYLALSSGSACSASNPRPSHVLMALGREESLARASLRFGLGRFTTEAEIDQALEILQKTILALRQDNV